MPDPTRAPLPGSLADLALRRGKELRRRRLIARRGATGLALAAVVAVGIAVRVGAGPGTSTPVNRPTTLPAPNTTPTTSTTPPVTTPTTVARQHHPTSTTLPHVAPTGAVTLQPWASNTQPSSQLTLGPSQSGQCLSGSRVDLEPSAWRCFAGANSIVDPCLAPPSGAAGATEVLCVPSPWQNAFLLKLTSPLALTSQNQPGSTSPTWAIELASGQRCVFTTGGVLTLDGVALVYNCGGVRSAGGLVTTSEPWTVRYAANVTGHPSTVAVAKAWLLSSPSPTPGSLWSSPLIEISPSSLGGVRLGMTVAQANRSAGVTFKVQGDGIYTSSSSGGTSSLAVGSVAVSGTTVVCFGAGASTSTQTVTTPQGFVVGETVTQLRDIYGSALVSYHTPPGIANFSGYLVHGFGGTFVFVLNSAGTSIDTVYAGAANVNPVVCAG